MPDFRNEIRAHLAAADLTASAERSVVEEINAHMEDRYAELRARGVSDEEALAAVRAELTAHDPLDGALRSVKPVNTHEAPLGAPSKGSVLRDIWSDVRYAFRTFTASPGFALSAIAALGIGTGAATAVFSMLNGVVLRQLPYPQPDRLVMLWEVNQAQGLRHQQVSPVSFMDYRSVPSTFTDAAAWWKPETSLTDERGEPLRVSSVEASENLFKVMGVSPAIGRGFEQDSLLFGSVPEAVISDALWHSRFGGDRSVVGRSIRLNGYATTVIGIMPPGFNFPDKTDVWSRLSWDMRHHSRGAHFMGAVARLRPGVTVDRANATVESLGARIAAENPSTNKGWSAEVVALDADVAGVFRPGLIALFGAASLLLLIACMNVANLLLARAAIREPEIAIRSALGASRARLLRQLLTEGVLLAAAGGAAGLLIASVLIRQLLAWSPVEIPRGTNVRIDGSVFGFSIAAILITTLLFALVPAWRASRANIQTVLRRASRGGGAGALSQNGRGLLVVFEVGLSVALLCASGLLVRSVAAMVHQDSGVHATDGVAVDIQLTDATYASFASAGQFYDRLGTALRSSPSVTAAGASNFLPLETGWRIPFERAKDPPAQPGSETNVQYHSVDGGYFHALGVPIVSGRGFDSRDIEGSKQVVIINQAMAERYWPGVDPIGQHIRAFGRQVGPLGQRLSKDDDAEIVGVVANVKNVSLTDAAEPALYSASTQFPFRRMYVVVRGKGTSAELTDIVRREVKRLDPALPIGDAKTIARVLAKATDPPRFLMVIMGAFALLAMLLAAFGIYGLLAYMVNERKREFGIRMAMGATRSRVLGLVLRQGATIAVGGSLVGIMIALFATRALAALLFGVQPRDAFTLVAAAAGVIVVAIAASFIPALRATRVEPMRTLRE